MPSWRRALLHLAHSGSVYTKGKRALPMPVRVVQAFLEEVMEEGLVADGTLAQDGAQVAGIWALREGISVALKHAGALPSGSLGPRLAGGRGFEQLA